MELKSALKKGKTWKANSKKSFRFAPSDHLVEERSIPETNNQSVNTGRNSQQVIPEAAKKSLFSIADIRLIKSVEHIKNIDCCSKENEEIIKKSIPLQLAINNLAKKDYLSESVFALIKENKPLQRIINAIAKNNFFSMLKNNFDQISKNAPLQQAIIALIDIDKRELKFFTDKDFDLLLRYASLVQSINILVKSGRFDKKIYFFIKENLPLQEAIIKPFNEGGLSKKNDTQASSTQELRLKEIDERLDTLIKENFNLNSFSKDYALFKKDKSFRDAIVHLINIGCFPQGNYSLTSEGNIPKIDDIYIFWSERFDYLKEEAFSQAINNLVMNDCFSLEAWAHIKYNRPLRAAINTLAKNNYLNKEIFLLIADANHYPWECRENKDLIKQCRRIQDACNNLVKIHCFSQENYILIKTDITLQEAINNLAKIRCLDKKTFDHIKMNKPLQNAINDLAKIRCLDKKSFDHIKMNRPLQNAINECEINNILNKNILNSLIANNEVLLKEKIKYESGKELDILEQIDEFQKNTEQFKNQDYKNDANQLIQDLYKIVTGYLVNGKIDFESVKTNISLAKLVKMDRREVQKNGLKLALAIVASLLTLPIGVPVLAWRIHKNPHSFFVDKEKMTNRFKENFISTLTKGKSSESTTRKKNGSKITPQAA